MGDNVMLVRPPSREYYSWTENSRYWDVYEPRSGDIVIATSSKCGTTWMQQIVSSLVFQDAKPRSIPALSPWVEACFRHSPDDLKRTLDAQTHRRFLKTHLPIDGIPVYDQVYYIHVARDGRDAALSMHNHLTGFSEEMLRTLDHVGMTEPRIGKPFPKVPKDPRAYVRWWLSSAVIPEHKDGGVQASFFETERGYWAERKRSNLLLVHYNDLSFDRDAEMRRVADFLDIKPDERVWHDLVCVAGFQEMQRAGELLMPHTKAMFSQGSRRFFNTGRIGSWREVLGQDELELYERKVKTNFSPNLAAWVEGGRAIIGDPRRSD